MDSEEFLKIKSLDKIFSILTKIISTGHLCVKFI